MAARNLLKLRKISLALPEAHEAEAWGAATFRVRNKMFAMYAAADNHHGDGREGVWIKAAPGNQQVMVEHAPKKFFVPPYMGPSGWVGVYLDDKPDWVEVTELLADGYRLIAPKKLLKELDAQSS